MFSKLRQKVQPGTEKRKVSRAAFYQSSYLLHMNNGIGSGAVKCWFMNISEGGVSIETGLSEMKQGDEIKVLYKIGPQYRNDSLKIQHASQAHDNYLYGCAFIDDDEWRSSIINGYVMKSLRK